MSELDKLIEEIDKAKRAIYGKFFEETIRDLAKTMFAYILGRLRDNEKACKAYAELMSYIGYDKEQLEKRCMEVLRDAKI